MKKVCLIFLCFLLIASAAACSPSPAAKMPLASAGGSFDPFGFKTQPAEVPKMTIAPFASKAPMISLPLASAMPASTPSSMGPYPTNTAEMYSSYAYMVSFDPARGWADFDYFSMLRGDEAVQWLVEEEGYSLTKAQQTVDDFADSEFIEKNTNPQLRTIDLREIPLKLMYHPDGSMVPGADPIDATLADLYHLYELDRDLVLDSFFYYVEVRDGAVVAVSQVYWP